MTTPSDTRVARAGVPVDSSFSERLQGKYQVYRNDHGYYAAALNQTNLEDNSNKYYMMQLLESSDELVQEGSPRRCYIIYSRSGRVGFGGNDNYDFFVSCEQAVEEFYRRFLERTGNAWLERRSFVRKDGKYDYVELAHEEEPSERPVAPVSVPAVSISPSVQRLMGVIFDPEVYKQTMEQFKVDTRRLPLGKLSKAQINKAYQILTQVSNNLETLDKKEVVALSSQFYTIIPHATGMTAPPVLDRNELIQEKLELLKVLDDLEVTGQLMSQMSAGNLLCSQYQSLNCQISSLADAHTRQLIQRYLDTNRGHHQFSLKIQEVYELSRQGETARFQNHGNVQLLWHGSRLANFVGILSNGLRINPNNVVRNGSMFGNGIYFANSATKSAQYMHASPGEYGILLLAEVSLGTPYELTTAQYVKQLPSGRHSTRGVGSNTPDPRGHVTTRDGVVFPIGALQKTGQSVLLYDEYIVYREDQVKLKYLLLVKV